MIDIESHINATHRDVTRDDERVTVVLKRTYDAEVADVWDALTDPDRMKRWFMPISGDLRPGGNFQLEGNAGGQILECEPPGRYKVTFGDVSSIVEVRLSPAGDERTDFVLEHSVPLAMAQSGAGAFTVGPGWDGALLGLALFVTGEVQPGDDPAEAARSEEALRYSKASVQAWEKAVAASGTATAEEIAQGKAMAEQFFAPGIN
ncbi:SRPBCC family protein [Nonomuraea typhae]|uniref:SRPBCC family protein n=1 Tax=Nonomuraea typhae TaxID=2603600 RepID=UPI0012FA2043|nr:SRPBCC family protein [Nonomuraea typhae]